MRERERERKRERKREREREGERERDDKDDHLSTLNKSTEQKHDVLYSKREQAAGSSFIKLAATTAPTVDDADVLYREQAAAGSSHFNLNKMSSGGNVVVRASQRTPPPRHGVGGNPEPGAGLVQLRARLRQRIIQYGYMIIIMSIIW